MPMSRVIGMVLMLHMAGVGAWQPPSCKCDMTRRQHAIKPECQTRRAGGRDGGRADRDMVMSQTHPLLLMLNVGGGYCVETDTTHSRSPDWERGGGVSQRVRVRVRRHLVTGPVASSDMLQLLHGPTYPPLPLYAQNCASRRTATFPTRTQGF